jgi:hypothetical protein
MSTKMIVDVVHRGLVVIYVIISTICFDVVMSFVRREKLMSRMNFISPVLLAKEI